ncbi:MAG TPA: hypothetical protein VEQ85_02860 [Lacipirellulaceae bacterium]|nr:hypothetical protein [Lacipirellulaceae bacterium]
MSRLTRLSEWLLRQPLLWGALAAMAFYAMVVPRAEAGSLVERMFAGGVWPFKAAATALAFAGLGGLGLRALGLLVQFGALERNALPPAPPEGQAPADAADLLQELDAAPPAFETTYFGRRLRRVLQLVQQRGTADALENDLHRMAAADRAGLADQYAGARVLAIAVPLIGVAGAAAGIAVALVGVSEGNWQAALPAILSSTGAAVGGLGQALGLTVALLFAHLAVRGLERRLLAAVDLAAEQQLLRRFTMLGAATDPHLASIQRMSEKLLATVEGATERHDALLAKSLASATRRWEEMAGAASALVHRSVGDALAAGLKEHAHAINGGVGKLADNLQNTVVRHAQILGENIDNHTAALADALEHHAAVMTEAERNLAAENGRRLSDMEAGLGEAMLLNATRQEKLIRQSEDLLKEMQSALVEAAGTTVAQQEQLIKQSDVLLKVVDATGQVRKLEEALNSNLLSLAASHNFEQTLTSLAAAVQLLSVRLRQPAIVRNEIDLRDDSSSKAA